MTDHFVQNPSEVVTIGDKVTVWVSEVDDQGRYNLTMREPGTDTGGQQGGPQGDTRERKEGHGRDFGGGHAPRGGGYAPRPYTAAPTGTGTTQAAPQKHPLAMQFEREKRQQGRTGFRGQKRDYNR